MRVKPSVSVAVAIPTYRRMARLELSIESVLAAARRAGIRVTLGIFDNEPNSDVPRLLRARFGDSFEYVGSDRNRGYVWNWNRAVRWSSEPKVPFRLLLEDDNMLTPEFFCEALTALEHDRECQFFYSAVTEFTDDGFSETWTPITRRGRRAVEGRTDRIDAMAWAFACQIKVSGLLVRNSSATSGLPVFVRGGGLMSDFRSLCELAVKAGPGYYSTSQLMRFCRNPDSLTASMATRKVEAVASHLWIVRNNALEVSQSLQPLPAEWNELLPAIGTDKLLLTRMALWRPLPCDADGLVRSVDQELERRSANLPWYARGGLGVFGDKYWRMWARGGQLLTAARARALREGAT